MEAIPVIMIALPFLAAAPAYALGRRKKQYGYILMITITVLSSLAAGALLLSGQSVSFSFPPALGLGLSLKADGFRTLYAAVACLMWLVTSLFTPEYMAHGNKQARYCLFTLLTMGATVGVFLSDDLITAFVFFEIMSFTSYCWVAHEETPGAMRAAQTYLAIAIFGGMAMLLGLMMLKLRIGTLNFEEMADAAQNIPKGKLYLPGVLILIGFGAKAGVFPLHVWLPKAHPVAPAPASALLSGILTKVGIFGILILTSRLFFGDALWGNLLLVLGLTNMVLGALLALFSVDLKRTLACSSMSQIGFILLGIGLQGLLSENNALAAQGTVLHMLNHSLIKLVLFICAGVVYLNVHRLNLNDIRGFGRKKWGLMLCFLVGAASISGIPFFSGYASKTLLHESLLEYIAHLQHLGESTAWYQAAEWLFVITGGLTFCYMLKLFIVIFVEKHPTRQAEFDAVGRSVHPLSSFALGGTTLLLFALGLYPEGLLTRIANLALPFLHAHEPEHAVQFLTGTNLLGGAKSLLVGAVLYLTLVRNWLVWPDGLGGKQYIDRWPDWLDMENSLYRPALQALVKLGYMISTPLDIQMDRLLVPFLHRILGVLAAGLDAVEGLFHAVGAFFTFTARTAETITDGLALFLMHTVFKRTQEKTVIIPVGNRFTYTLGRFADSLSARVRRLLGMKPSVNKFIYLFAAAWGTAHDAVRRIQRTLSFSLILFALGLVVLLAFLLVN
jgi:formate hydrogenlyase subunit 3/multisubunit Na+/H+ antiporter MnhD subunit